MGEDEDPEKVIKAGSNGFSAEVLKFPDIAPEYIRQVLSFPAKLVFYSSQAFRGGAGGVIVGSFGRHLFRLDEVEINCIEETGETTGERQIGEVAMAADAAQQRHQHGGKTLR